LPGYILCVIQCFAHLMLPKHPLTRWFCWTRGKKPCICRGSRTDRLSCNL